MNSGNTTPGIIVEESRSYIANGAITKYAAVCLSNTVTGDVALPASANDEDVVGIANYGVADNKTIEVVVKGTMVAVAGAAITRGQLVVVSGVLGRLKADPQTSGTISHIVGKALTPAATAGDEFVIEISLYDKTWES